MLWTKAWLETRWRLALIVGIFAALLTLLALASPAPGPTNNNALASIGLDCVLGCIVLAGAGIQTQPVFQTVRGVHASMTFTLALPVSRLRLLFVRASFGFFEALAFLALVCCAEWFFLPFIRASATPTDIPKMIVECVSFGAAAYSLSVFFSALFDLIWQMYATMLTIGALWFLFSRLHLPRSMDIFRLMTGDSPLVTHNLYLGRIGVSGTLALVSLAAAACIVRTREY